MTEKINIFILCFNEARMIRQTIRHYRRMFGDDDDGENVKIHILDNESTDESREIAMEEGCNVIVWRTGGKLDCIAATRLRNSVWKFVESGWVLMVDMDEWLMITRDELDNERRVNGTTLIRADGYEMIADSLCDDLSDVKLENVVNGVFNKFQSKTVCFWRPDIQEMNYAHGAHTCHPVGNIVWSKNVYLLEHFKFLGIPYLVNNYRLQFSRRSDSDKAHHLATNYTDDEEEIKARYRRLASLAKPI